MAINFHPKTGQVLNCDYTDLRYGEMSKKRLSVVISPNHFQREGLCTVVPLSTTPPKHIEKFHHILESDPDPQPSGAKVWVKADMLMTVSFERLNGVWLEKVDGKRNYLKIYVSDRDLICIKKCCLYALGLGELTQHLK